MSISGKFLSATVGVGTIEGTHEWTVNERGDRLEATTGANNGRGKKDVGVIDTMVKIVFYLDITTGEFQFIRTGTTLTNLKLFLDNTATNPMYLLTSARVFDTTVRGQVRDRFIVEADIEAVGDVVTQNEPN